MRKLQAWGGAAALLAALLLGGCARQDTVTATPEQAATPTPEVTAESTPSILFEWLLSAQLYAGSLHAFPKSYFCAGK